MALNKKQTSMTAKIVIIFVAVAFILVPIMGVIGSLGSGPSTPTTQPGSTTQIAAKYKARIDADSKVLATKPKEYAILVDQANAYSDWAGEVQQATQGSGEAQPIFFLAVDAYKKALAVKPGDPAVATDLAIAQFYSGGIAEAIATIGGVMKKNPKFAPAFFNAGIFYRAAGDNAKAIAALEAAIKIDPKGQNVAQAQQLIDEMRKAGPSTSSPATSGK
jgi:tetratricopeptide (TPR) repeat protein